MIPAAARPAPNCVAHRVRSRVTGRDKSLVSGLTEKRLSGIAVFRRRLTTLNTGSNDGASASPRTKGERYLLHAVLKEEAESVAVETAR